MKVPIDETPVGEAMNAAIAEILGLTVEWRRYGSEPYAVYLDGHYIGPNGVEEENWKDIQIFSIDIELAWRLWDGNITVYKIDNQCQCLLDPEYEPCMKLLSSKATAMSDTIAHAICRAFLKANGVEYIEVPE